jgi:phosphoribosylformylglycinamidine (FGAM) synthase PurS component
MTTEKVTRPIPVHQVEVKLRADYADAEAHAALALLHGLGLGAIKDLRMSKVYDIKGPLNLAHTQQVARELLTDPVTHEFKILQQNAQPVFNGQNSWRVEVWLKTSVTDPVGETVKAAIAESGLPEPVSVRVGQVYHLSGKCGRNQLEKAVARSLANPVIHRVVVSEAHS